MLHWRCMVRGASSSLHRRVHTTVARVLERHRPDRGFEVTRRELVVDALDSAHDGVMIAHLSDVHVGLHTPERRIRAAVETINEAEPDLVFLTGDYVTYSAVALPDVPRLLGGLVPPTFAVLGNHDHWVAPGVLTASLSALGYTVLCNQFRVVDVRGRPVTILGVDDRRTRHDDVELTFRDAPSSGSRLVLAHVPTTADELPAGEGLVCFAGHTHGGQVTLPAGATDRILGALGWPYMRGYYRVRGNHLYVNRGLGFGRHSSFLGRQARPEVAFVTLRRSVP